MPPRNARISATVLSRGRAKGHDLLGATPVPRYFFHFSDGERQFSDGKGHELDGLRAARAHATGQVRELKAAMCDARIQDFSAWSMSVADAKGAIVFVIGFDLKPRPVPVATARRAAGDAPAARSSGTGARAKGRAV